MPIHSAYIKGAAFAAVCALAGSFSGSAVAATCLGNCGSQAATDGVVTGAAEWISTNNGVATAGYGLGSETNGTTLTTGLFSANANSHLDYNFNYVTSDGAQQTNYADYAWVQLFDSSNNLVATLLTARTQPTGNIIPGFGLPAIDATLTPAAVPIIAGAPTWSPLGATWSNTCFGPGCGYTGWVNSQYTIASAGSYYLVFGVVNWIDEYYDSGLAFNGVKIDGKPIDVGNTPLPAALPLFASGLGGLGFLALRRKRKAAALAA
jgi:hypothetical protein